MSSNQPINFVATLDTSPFKAAESNIARSITAMDGQFASVGANIKSAFSGISGLLSGVGAALGAVTLGGIIKDTVNTMSAFEQLEIQLRSVMGSAEAGDQAFAWIKKFAADTPFEVSEVTKAFMLLKNMGLDPMDGTLKALADQSAKAGQGAEGLQRTALALGQAFTKGKLQGEEMNQLLEAGVPAWDLLSQALGKSAADLQEMAGKGELGRDAIKSLIEEIGKAAEGSSGAAMNSLSGQVSNLHDNLANFADDIRKAGGLGGVKDIIGELNNAFQSLKADGSLNEWAEGISASFNAMASVVTAAMTAVTEAVSVFGEVVGSVFSSVPNYIAQALGGETRSGIENFVNALKGVELTALAVGTTFKLAAQVIMSAMQQTGIWVIRFAETASKALALDFEGAKAAWNLGGAVLSDSIQYRMDNISAILAAGRAKADAIIMRPWELPKVNGGGGGRPPPSSGKKVGKDGKDSGADPSQMPTFEAGLASAKAAAVELDAIHGMSKAQELAYWQAIAAQQDLSEKDKLAVSKKVSQARIALLQEQAQQEQQLSQIGIDATRDAALAKVELDSQGIQERLQAGEISQSEALAAEQAFEDKRYAIKRAALDAAASVLDPDRDPVQLAQIHAQIEALEQQHQLRLAQIRSGKAKASADEQYKLWDDVTNRMSSLWDQGVQAMMNGTLTWRNAFRASAMQIGAVMGNLTKNMIKDWWKAETTKTGATNLGTVQRLAIESWAAIKSTAIWAASAAKNILISAWQAMAGAYSAIAGIPYVGPVLAPITAAVVFAGVAGLARNVASAEGGYDIPAGINPLTQLHEKEMVLPAKHADTIRALGEDGNAGRGGDTFINHFHTPDTGGMKRLLMDNQAGLAAALVAARRNGHLPTSRT